MPLTTFRERARRALFAIFLSKLYPDTPRSSLKRPQKGRISDQNGNIPRNHCGVTGWGIETKCAPHVGLRIAPNSSGQLPAVSEIRPNSRIFDPFLSPPPPEGHQRGPGALFDPKCFFVEGTKGHPKYHTGPSNCTPYPRYGRPKFQFSYKIPGSADQKSTFPAICGTFPIVMYL